MNAQNTTIIPMNAYAAHLIHGGIRQGYIHILANIGSNTNVETQKLSIHMTKTADRHAWSGRTTKHEQRLCHDPQYC
jgi:hypothetical protein